jgi:transposase
MARRRTFTAAFKLRILHEADACTKPGEINALLRREGIYSSLLTNWRRERDAGVLGALTPKQRGPKPTRDPRDVEIERLKAEKAKLEERLRVAELICEAQKKVAQILSVPPRFDSDGKSS